MTENLLDRINAVHREVGDGKLPSGDAHTVVLRRSYDADPDDVWDAMTKPDRLSRWFLPATGDLELGGRYQLEGNAGGEITRCDKPRLLAVTWEYGEGPASEVEVPLTPSGDGDSTEFELVHRVPAGEFWDQFGPGATGVGWDLGLFALSSFLDGTLTGKPQEWEASPEAAKLMTRSSELWGAAHTASGADAETAQAAAAATHSFYVPQETTQG